MIYLMNNGQAQPPNYIILDGLEIDGNSNNAGGNCVGIYPRGVHHIVIENSLIHGCGTGGLGFGAGEYYWMVNNTVYNNSSLTSGSGLDVYEPNLATASDPGFAPNANDQALYYHIVVANNIVHDNMEAATSSPAHTDSNGIIFDDFNHSQNPGAPYTQPTLIKGNIAYNNGAGGVTVFESQYVTVANNSAYNNYIDPLNPSTTWRSDIICGDCNNSIFINNAAYAFMGGTGNNAYTKAYSNLVDTSRGPANVTWTTNIGYPLNWGTINGTGNRFDVDPQFNNPSAGDFSLQAGSQANGSATPEPWLSSGTPDMGAWQPTSTSPANANLTYYSGNIVNSQSNRCLDADTGSIGNNGTKVQLWSCWGGQNQSWTVNSNGTITNDQGGRCLDADTNTIGSNGTIVQLWDCTGGQNQSWTVNSNNTITNNQSGRCLDADLGTIAGNGTKVQLWDCTGGQNQAW